jgi:pseudouridine synthase
VPEGERVLKTLDRLLSRAGICSRTDAGELLRSGRVRVDGKVATDPEQWIDVGASRVSLDGQPLRRAKPIVLLLSKPKGVVTSTTDKLGRPTIHDFLPKDRGHLFPVGRLDVDTSGLLLVTNDAQLAERLTNPEFHVPKTYLVKASGRLSDEQLDRLREGVVLADGPTRPAAVTRLREPGGRTVFELTITEGRNRQVRRMVEAVGSRVLKLVRVAVGPLPLGTLHPGQVRELERGEVEALRHASRARRALRRRR